MRTSKRHKTLAEIKAQCKAQGLEFHDKAYKAGSDCITVRGGGGHATFNTVTGWFCGTTDRGVSFDSHNTHHENEPWFQALLDFFYTDD